MIKAFVLAGLPTTKTLTLFLAYWSKACPWTLKILTLAEQIEEMEAELKRNAEQQEIEKENLVIQLQKAEEKRKLEDEEIQKRNQEELKKLEREIHDAEQKKINAERDAEIEHLNNQIGQMKKMHAHQQEMLNQQHKFLVEQQRRADEASSANPFMEILGGVVDAAKTVFVSKLLKR